MRTFGKEHCLGGERTYIEAVRVLLEFSSSSLVKIWEVYAQVAGKDVPSRPFDAALEAMYPVSSERFTVLETAADFHWLRKDWVEAFTRFSELLVVQETSFGLQESLDAAERTEGEEEFYRKLGVDHLDVARTLYGLRVCVSNAGRTDEGEEFFRRALAIPEQKLGADHPHTASTRKALHSITNPWSLCRVS